MLGAYWANASLKACGVGQFATAASAASAVVEGYSSEAVAVSLVREPELLLEPLDLFTNHSGFGGYSSLWLDEEASVH